MTCSACSGAVERVLGKLDGVKSYNVNLEQQTVNVQATAPFETVLEKIKKTGKEVLSSKVVS
ncbi:copper chaperone [Malassezia pachydermatis]|uniref:Copper chaperone n=1 Tax=Malassezia pachydermatis TaxID=77020 RepID=A0A0M9VPZ8_9BASI|nr:copper chaperone [Malassezia pachydermatis]KOS14925.1 copper chaperone [Malassezia pachydermatis]